MNTTNIGPENDVSGPTLFAQRSPSLRFIGWSALIVVLLTIFLGAVLTALLVSGSDDQNFGPVTTSAMEPATPDPVAYGYFGQATLAQGSTMTTAIDGQNITSVDDVRVTSVPPGGITAVIADGEDGQVTLEVSIPGDMQTGDYNILFEIVGEPEQVAWTFTVTAR